MSSRKAVFREYEEYGLYVPEVVERYYEWEFEDKYRILVRIDLQTLKSDVFAIKCSKRGNDVYRHRVCRHFMEFVSIAEKPVFFNPKDRRRNKKTKALFVSLTYGTKIYSLKDT